MDKDLDNERLDGTKESSKDGMDITLTLHSDDHTTMKGFTKLRSLL